MAMSPFTDPLGELSFTDIVSFCNLGLAESVNLDYKREIPAPEKLAKTISAFANTYGGLMIIGIEDDGHGRPKAPFEGLPVEPKLEEQIWNVVLEHIYPPVLPEIHACAPVNSRTFILVRVSQSTTTPHAVRHKTAVYFRTGNVTKPESLERAATVDEIEWLRDRRRLSTDLKSRLADHFEERLRTLQTLRGLGNRKSMIYVSFGPKFPTSPLLSVAELSERRRRLKLFRDAFSEEIPVQDGLVRTYVPKQDVEFYCETNIFGFAFEASQLHARQADDRSLVFLSLIVDSIADVAKFGQRFLAGLGYWGVCELNVSVREVAGKILCPFDHMVEPLLPSEPKTQLSNRIEWQRDVTSSAWMDDDHLADTIAELTQAIAWSFGWKLGREDVRRHLNQSARWAASN